MLVYEKNSVMLLKKNELVLPMSVHLKLERIREVQLLKKYYFNSDYELFVLSLMEMKSPEDLSEAFKSILTYFFTTAVHSKRISEELYGILNLLKKWCEKGNKELAIGVISTFANTKFLHEFLIACPKEEPRRLIYSLLKTTLQKLYHTKQSMLMDSEKDNPSLILTLLHSMFKAIGYLPKRLCGQYFQLLCFFCELSDSLRDYLAKNLLVGVALEVLGAVDTNECKDELAKSFKDFKITEKPLIHPLEDKAPPLDESEEVVQTKFPLSLIKHLILPSLRIQDIRLKDTLRAFEDTTGLTNLYKSSKTSKVSTNLLSQILKTLCEEASDTYFTPITTHIYQKLTTDNYKDLIMYYNTLFKLYNLKDESKVNKVIATTVSTLNTAFEAQPYSVIISYIDFILVVFFERGIDVCK
jgi:DNA-binding ferritin-like protein (Dps family)